jgi:hypothetical protein
MPADDYEVGQAMRLEDGWKLNDEESAAESIAYMEEQKRYLEEHYPELSDPAYIAYMEEQERRWEEKGELAAAPDTLACYACGGYKGDGKGPERKVVAFGPIINKLADPTQSYELECGHTVI